VFYALLMRQADGVAAETIDEGSPTQFFTAMFASLQAVKYCKELIGNDFEKHPTMAPMFNRFMFTKPASKSNLWQEESRIGDVISKMAEL
jgi:hypothetical protein